MDSRVQTASKVTFAGRERKTIAARTAVAVGALWAASFVLPPAFAQSSLNDAARPSANLGNTAYADGVTHPTIQSCIDAAGPAGTCVVPARASVTLTPLSRLRIDTAGTTLRCERGAVIQQGSGFRSEHLIRIAGNDVTISGCSLRGSISATNSALVFATGVSGAVISNNTVEDVTPGNFGLYVGAGATNFRIENNTLTRKIAGAPILVISNIPGGSVSAGHIVRNAIVSSGGVSENDISLWTTAMGASLFDMEISDNVMSGGPVSCARGGCFCVEVGGFGGPGPANIVVSGNICTATGGINGGYSLAGTPPSQYRVTGNVYDASGQKTIIAAYEVSGSGAAVTGNLARNLTGPGYCISVNMLSSSSISENTCDGFWNGVNGAGISVYGGAAGRAGNNLISNNKIVFPEISANPHYGIWVQCNHRQVDCSGNTFSGNHIQSNGGSATIGIRLERDYGTMTNTVIEENEILNANTGVDIGAGVMDTRYSSKINSATVPLKNRGTGTVAK